MGDEERTEPKPPYMAYKTLRNQREQFKLFMPSRIDRSGLANLSGHNKALFLNAARYLGLIDDKGNPQPPLYTWVEAEDIDEYRRTLKDILERAYPNLLGNTSDFDLAKASPAQFDEQFTGCGKGDTFRKCQAFFIQAAQDAGITISPQILAARKPGGRPGPRTRKSTAKPSSTISVNNHVPSQGEQPPPARTVKEQMVGKFPNFDPAWPPEVQAKWLEAFARVWDKVGGEPDEAEVGA